MSGIATAIIGGAIITGAVASNASNKADKAATNELQFAQQQYDDWKDVYGPIQQNLSNYYANLSPEQYITIGNQALEEEYASASTRLSENLAQRGITDSGLAAGMEQAQLFDLAKSKATVRQTAPQAVAEQRLNFLSVGNGNNPSGNYQNALANNTNRLTQNSNSANAAFGQSINTGIKYGIGMIGQSGGSVDSSALAGTPNIDYSTGVA